MLQLPLPALIVIAVLSGKYATRRSAVMDNAIAVSQTVGLLCEPDASRAQCSTFHRARVTSGGRNQKDHIPPGLLQHNGKSAIPISAVFTAHDRPDRWWRCRWYAEILGVLNSDRKRRCSVCRRKLARPLRVGNTASVWRPSRIGGKAIRRDSIALVRCGAGSHVAAGIDLSRGNQMLGLSVFTDDIKLIPSSAAGLIENPSAAGIPFRQMIGPPRGSPGPAESSVNLTGSPPEMCTTQI